jgi:hypothetical protein
VSTTPDWMLSSDNLRLRVARLELPESKGSFSVRGKTLGKPGVNLIKLLA